LTRFWTPSKTWKSRVEPLADLKKFAELFFNAPRFKTGVPYL